MRLRYLLFAALSLTTLIPVVTLVVWPNSRAMNYEMEQAGERLLLLSENLDAALERYDRDVRASFRVLARNVVNGGTVDGGDVLLENLGFRHVCIARHQDGRVVGRLWSGDYRCPDVIPDERLVLFRSMATADRVAYSAVLPAPDGEPAVYIVWAMDGLLAVGAISTDYFVELADNIAFGERGHAVIVDHTGRVLAHPNTPLRLERQDLSELPPVRGMLGRETGASVFWSPAFAEMMIAGFTWVEGPGWGVMTAQPLAEVEHRVEVIWRSGLAIIALGLAFAAVASWLLSGYMTRPLQSVVDAARRMAAGDETARVSEVSRLAPSELRELQASFNAMADALQTSSNDKIEALQRAELASTAKTRLLANMSHELRTPLNAIIGFAEAIRMELFGPVGSDRYREYARDIQESGQFLVDIIDDLLDVSRIEAGEMDLRETVFDVKSVLDMSAELVRLRAEKKGVALKSELPDGLPRLRADARMFRQIFANLLSNSVKFTPSGGSVTLTACVRASGEYEFRVSDTGIGIEARDLSRVLQPFKRGEGAADPTIEGSGLGLAIVRSLVGLHGGTLELSSAVDQGTDVYVFFPRDRVVSAAPSADGTPRS